MSSCRQMEIEKERGRWRDGEKERESGRDVKKGMMGEKEWANVKKK